MRGLLVAAAFAANVAAPAFALDRTEQAMIAAVDRETVRGEQLLEKLVNVNSGTMNLPGVTQVGQMMRAELEGLGFTVRWVPMEKVGRAGHLVATHTGQQSSGGKRMLLIGHLDTVFELASPFQTYKVLSPGVAQGPGVNDMKGGLVVMVQALRAMKEAGALKDAHITIVLTGDEERVGAPRNVSREELVAAARASDLALEFEGLARDNGVDHGSIARRSSSGWTVRTTARSGHSSAIFGQDAGDGAAYELARIIADFRKELPEPNLTFNVGLMLSGESVTLDQTDTGGSATGKSNVIPPVGIAEGDMRTLSNEQTERVREKMKAIVARHLNGTHAEIQFTDGYPAMPPTEGSRAILARLNAINKEMGLPVMPELDPLKRGAGDIAYVSHIVDGLIGLGAAGEGSHAPGETVDLKSLPLQAKRAAILMYRLSKEKR
ncbi:MAG TPA: M20/M25/M40 family metallo-hydrolase [Hyphomonadaceae bacterium]|nr:M20/M25/M40 family metallo-hydrolase [Hyphomonadaceae bacterium]